MFLLRSLPNGLIVRLALFLLLGLASCDDDNSSGNAENKITLSGSVNDQIKANIKPSVKKRAEDVGYLLTLGWENKAGDSVAILLFARKPPLKNGSIEVIRPGIETDSIPDEAAIIGIRHNGNDNVSNGTSGTIDLNKNNDSRIKGTITNVALTNPQSGKTIKLNGQFSAPKKLSNAAIKLSGYIQKNLNTVYTSQLTKKPNSGPDKPQGRLSLILSESNSGQLHYILGITFYTPDNLGTGTYSASALGQNTPEEFAYISIKKANTNWLPSGHGTVEININNQEKLHGQITNYKLKADSSSKNITLNGDFTYYK